jgi:hypothetical protein
MAFNFADSECNTSCCPSGKWTLTVSNTAVTIENSAFSGVGCPTYSPTAIHLIFVTSSYGYLTTSTAVWLAVRDSNGLVVQGKGWYDCWRHHRFAHRWSRHRWFHLVSTPKLLHQIKLSLKF